jgi:hypothetical protein
MRPVAIVAASIHFQNVDVFQDILVGLTETVNGATMPVAVLVVT